MELGRHTLKSYDQQLNHLMDLIFEMGGHVRMLVDLSRKSLSARSEDLVKEAKSKDGELNRLEAALEESATAILALQSPVAVDLRFVTTALKISGLLERSGDLAKNTIKRSVSLGSFQNKEIFSKLEKMMDLLLTMLGDALASVQERDAQKALDVWKRDDAVDDLYHEIFGAIQKEMQGNKGNIEACTHLVFMAKNMERLADYITNMAKTVHYIVTGVQATKALIRGGDSASSSAQA